MNKKRELAGKTSKNKRAIVTSTLLYWIIAVTVLILVVVFAILLKGKLAGMVDYIKGIFRK